jgi:hypothetical protein
METEGTNDPAAVGAATEGSQSDVFAETSFSADPHERRRKRLEEYEVAALQKRDPDDAVLAIQTGDLAVIGSALGENIKQQLSQGANAELVRELEPTLASYLRVCRQLDRLWHLEMRVGHARRQSAELQESLALLKRQGGLHDSVG